MITRSSKFRRFLEQELKGILVEYKNTILTDFQTFKKRLNNLYSINSELLITDTSNGCSFDIKLNSRLREFDTFKIAYQIVDIETSTKNKLIRLLLWED